MNVDIRKMKLPDDYEEFAEILNTYYSEPVSDKQLQTEEDNIPPGKLDYDEQGKLTGWDRPKWVAEWNGRVVGYAIAWRAPWTEPGSLYQIIINAPRSARQGNRTSVVRNADTMGC